MSIFPAVKRTISFPGKILLLTLTLFQGAASPAAADEAGKPPLFVVRTAAGPPLRGPLQELKADWSLRVEVEGEATSVPGGDVLTVRRADLPLPPLPADDHVLLANGDRIPFRAARLAGEKLLLRHRDLAGGGEASLPLAAVSVLWRVAPDKVADAEKLRRQLATQARARDTVCLRNGDVVAGVLTGLDEQKVEVEVDRKVVAVKMPQVAYVALNTELADTLRPRGVYARLTLADSAVGRGGRLSLTRAVCADGVTLQGTTAFGAAVAVPLTRVAALDLYRGRAVYLSDLKPAKYEYLPYLDGAWPFAADANVAGHDLVVGGSAYSKGVGLHSHSRLTYRLAGGYRRFQALVGLDDRDGRRGSARVRVLADGRPLDLGASGELTARGGPRAVDVSVAGVRELTLEVDFGKGGDVQGVVDWADARLVK
jgi:hypothetical protein